ncbi:C45 family autoproteolytic acyltransferase/hydolase [Fusibacter ferrireducens]|uniref:Acyl-CoA--6-aminopenicillanic acid acyltransferase n=1 Tax=Fusibacter ferrireducens TaxID=2785058 RepID=A0ABR9ZNA0_9FIRM|nr:C45 family peptidase [Fusibacter ferrireducens]MBF4691947.1 acyl-CoA--6-aminopenicillanic acid acyltransferase [Fusibacter ferrireducens]
MKNRRTTKAEYIEISGSSYEIGKQMGKILPQNTGVLSPDHAMPKVLLDEAFALYDQFCPGLTDELRGYADAIGVELVQLQFCSMTYLRPNCSEMVLMPSKTDNDHILLARSYEFAPQFEDFRVFKLSPRGKYAHIGGSIADFGRSEGLNEKGLGISMTSCGFPVSNQKEMRSPTFKGLQFWAVVRSLLENCKDVGEALDFVQRMPIAYNINLLIADASGRAVLYETLDGASAYKEIHSGNHSDPKYLHATNHPVLEPLRTAEPFAMKNSVVRYQTINDFIEETNQHNIEEIKAFLLSDYPQGLNCRGFDAFFGTIKSVIMDLNDLSFHICWAGQEINGWQKYDFKTVHSGDSDQPTTYEIEYYDEPTASGFFDRVSLK